MDLGLKGRVAVVTGASRGIGLAVTQALVAEGAHVVAGALTASDELDALVETSSVAFLQVDLASADGPAALVSFAGARIDILVNNVGAVSPRPDGFLSVSDEQWLRSIGIDLMPAVRATRSALPIMLEAGRGSIVMVSSVNAFLPDPLVIDYSAAKGALTNFAKALSKEVGPRGVRVNTVSPGPVATALWLGQHGVAETVARASGAKPEEVARGAAAQSVTGRFTQPNEVADLVVLLASDRTSNVTGANITIDGGLTTTL